MKRKTKCEGCGEEFDYTVIEFGKKEMTPPKRCNDCSDRDDSEQQKGRHDLQRQERWMEICPPLYRATDPARVPSAYLRLIEEWEMGPRGLGFVGKPGLGKTRTAMLILKKHHKSGVQCEAISATMFSLTVVDQFSDDAEKRDWARDRLSKVTETGLLLFDDLGKGKMTERAEMELYGMLEYRTSYMLPTIWTANSDSARLLSSMSKERGEAILRRLVEFSEIV